MRASASAGAPANFPIGVIGPKADLTYTYDYLGAGPETLADIARHSFADTLRKAERPMVLVGAGALCARRRRRGRVAGGQGRGRSRRGQGRLERLSACCTARRRASARSISASCRGEGGLNARQMAASGTLDVLFLLGVDEIDIAAGAFVVYIGTHGDRGATRADVVLPGAAYPEKSAIYVNTEGRVQMATRASFPPGDAREDWAILRALSDVLGKNGCPMTRSRRCARRCSRRYPHMHAHRPDRAGRCRRPAKARRPRRHCRQGAVRARASRIFISPIRSRAVRR